MKHTPGPWEAGGSETTLAVWVKDASGKTVASVRNDGEDWANACLIAAAPEMLEALKQLAEFAAREMGLELEECVAGPIGRARAVINKVEGS